MNLISIATMPFKSYKLMIQGDKPGSQVGDEVIIAFSAHNFAHVAPLADIEGTCADSHIATDWTQPSNSLKILLRGVVVETPAPPASYQPQYQQ